MSIKDIYMDLLSLLKAHLMHKNIVDHFQCNQVI
jgi:hypothetical protein